MSQQEHIEQGTVAAINDRGVRIGETWFNWSKFAEVGTSRAGAEGKGHLAGGCAGCRGALPQRAVRGRRRRGRCLRTGVSLFGVDRE